MKRKRSNSTKKKRRKRWKRQKTGENEKPDQRIQKRIVKNDECLKKYFVSKLVRDLIIEYSKPYRVHACYLISSPNSYKSYIGYAVNPERRIKQHNGDLKSGGAKKTKKFQGNARFVAIVEPFLDEKDALRFEWAWFKKYNRVYNENKCIQKLETLLKEEKWTLKATSTSQHKRLNIHWFRDGEKIQKVFTQKNVFCCPIENYSNSTIESVMKSMYPFGFKS